MYEEASLFFAEVAFCVEYEFVCGNSCVFACKLSFVVLSRRRCVVQVAGLCTC